MEFDIFINKTLMFQVDGLSIKNTIDQELEFFVIDWFEQIIGHTQLHCLDGVLGILLPGYNKNILLLIKPTDRIKKSKTIDIR